MIVGSTLVVAAYLLGSISSAILICRLLRLPDPRTEGSGNPGATNVLRLAGKGAAAATLFGDLLKGLLPVLAGQLIGLSPGWLALVGTGALLGHLYPVFFQFRGGKGVATALGVLLGLAWQVALAAAATWLIIAKVFRISSLSALIATLLTPLYAWLLGAPAVIVTTLIPVCALILWRHKGNIQRLISGAEQRIEN